ncbi:MAG TPA: Ig-like domain-containing protein [Allosphingosinicella sp.]|nr:Ig-like domain-containing protein [Allosphingosinicella sp.]
MSIRSRILQSYVRAIEGSDPQSSRAGLAGDEASAARAAFRMSVHPAGDDTVGSIDVLPNDPGLIGVPTTLSRAQVAVVGYNTGFSSAGDPANTTSDSLQFVILTAIGSGTIIRFTDRAWNGSAFVAGGGDGSLAFTAPSDLAAGTVVSLTFSGGNFSYTINGVTTAGGSAGGFDVNEAGDAIYVYQGPDADTPTTFLTAIEIADGNSTFNGNLTNTGLTVGTTAVAVQYDSAAYSGPTTDAFAHLHNNSSLVANLHDSTNWTGDNHVSGGQVGHDLVEQGPFNVAPDLQLWSAAGGGGNGIVSTNIDATVSGGTLGHNLVIRYTNDQGDMVQVFANPLDIAFDTAEGKFFIIDSTAGEDGRILQGNISDLIGNPNTPVTTTLLYSSNQPLGNVQSQIRDLQIDTVNNLIYFTHGERLERIAFDAAGQTSTVLANFGTGSGNPNGTSNNFIDDFVINFATGTAYLTSHRIVAAQDGDIVSRNYIYRVSNLSGSATFGNGQISVLPFSPDDDEANNGINFANGEGFPQEFGTLEGIALSADGNTLYFTAARTLYDHDGDGGFAGDGNPATTDPILTLGGVFSYSLVGNPTGVFTVIFQPTDDGNDGSQAISEVNGPQGLLDDLEIDPLTGQLYFLDLTGDQLGITNPPGDEGIWRLNANGTGLEFIQAIFNNDALGAGSLWLNRAPTVTASTQATPGVTEASNAPASGSTALVQPFLSLDVTDIETASNPTQQLNGATVWISNNFQSGATHQDTLTINGTTSGTVNGITYTYNAATGAMRLTGITTFNNYEATIALIRFNTSGDDVTAFGAAQTRTISWAVSDGLNHSDPVSTTISVTGINDAPVNTVGAAMNFTEDTSANPVTGISVFDVDANPATQDITVTLSVGVGTLTIRTDVAGGIQASDVISGNGTGTIVITATQNEINATLANATGLTFTAPADYNGSANLTITTNDNGFNGNDPALTGTGTTEQDQDVKVINIAAVADIVADNVSVAEDSGANILDLLANDTFENPTRFISAVTQGAHGTVTINDNNTAGVLTDDFVVYTVTDPNYNGSDSFDYTVTSPAGVTETVTVNVTVTAVNDPISTTAPASLTLDEDALNFAVAGLSIADVDAALAPAGVYDVTLTATNGTLTLTTLTGLTFSTGDGTADATMTFHGTLADLNAALATATYTPTANYNGSATITLSATDFFGGIVATGTGAATNDSDIINVTVNAINDAPVNTVPGTQTINEDGTITFSGGLLISISDVDANGLDVTTTVTVLHGTLTVGGNAGLTSLTGDGTGTVVIVGSVAEVNNALNGLLYTPTAHYNGPDTLTITTNDGGNTGAPGALQDQDTVTINITAINDTPVVAVQAAVASTEQVTGFIDPAATITDVELGALNGGNGDYSGSTLTVGRNGGAAPEDLLSFGPSGAFTVNGANLQVGALVFATFTGGNGTPLVITFTSSGTPATQALVNAVVQSLQYTYTGNTPPASIVMDYTFNDGAPGNAGQGAGGSPTGTDSITINITDTPENAPPVLDLNGAAAGDGSTAAVTEQSGPGTLAPDLTITDADDTDLVGATVVISGPVSGDLLAVAGVPNGTSGTISWVWNGTDTLTFTGTASLADYQALLRTVTFEANGDDPGTSRTISWRVNDGIDNSNQPTTIVTVTPQNDPPTLTGTGNDPTFTEGGARSTCSAESSPRRSRRVRRSPR